MFYRQGVKKETTLNPPPAALACRAVLAPSRWAISANFRNSIAPYLKEKMINGDKFVWVFFFFISLQKMLLLRNLEF